MPNKMPQPSIAKVLTRKSKEFRGFGASKDYIERIEAAGSIRQFNLEIGHDAAKHMDDVWERAGRPKMNPVYHFVRSYIADSLPHEQIWDDFEKSLKEIGWENRQVIGAIHVDSQHIHVHGVGNKIHPETLEIWKPYGRERTNHARATGATELFSSEGERKIDPERRILKSTRARCPCSDGVEKLSGKPSNSSCTKIPRLGPV